MGLAEGGREEIEWGNGGELVLPVLVFSAVSFLSPSLFSPSHSIKQSFSSGARQNKAEAATRPPGEVI